MICLWEIADIRYGTGRYVNWFDSIISWYDGVIFIRTERLYLALVPLDVLWSNATR